MKCAHCDRLILEKFRNLRIACQLKGCISHGIKPGSKKFQMLVMGKTQEEIDLYWKLRQAKNVEAKKERGFFKDKSNNPFSLEFWIKKGFTREESEEKINSKFKKAINTKRNMGYFDDAANNPYSKKFGEKTGLTVEEAELRIREKNHNCPEYWIKRGCSYAEALEKSKASASTNSIGNRIAKYGDELGQRLYDETRQKISQNWNPKSASHQKFGSSVEANRFFLRVYKYCRRLGYERSDFMFAVNRGEMFIRDGKNIYFYDFCIKPLKIIVEYNGEHVHPNVKQMNEREYNDWKHAYTKEKAEIVDKRDHDKMNIAKTAGFKYCIIWSKDPNAFNTVTKFIKEHHDCKNY